MCVCVCVCTFTVRMLVGVPGDDGARENTDTHSESHRHDTQSMHVSDMFLCSSMQTPPAPLFLVLKASTFKGNI